MTPKGATPVPSIFVTAVDADEVEGSRWKRYHAAIREHDLVRRVVDVTEAVWPECCGTCDMRGERARARAERAMTFIDGVVLALDRADESDWPKHYAVERASMTLEAI